MAQHNPADVYRANTRGRDDGEGVCILAVIAEYYMMVRGYVFWQLLLSIMEGMMVRGYAFWQLLLIIMEGMMVRGYAFWQLLLSIMEGMMVMGYAFWQLLLSII